MYNLRNTPMGNLKEGYEWNQAAGVRRSPKNLSELSSPGVGKQFSLDERIAMAEGFQREKEKEDYLSSLIKKPELGSTQPKGKTFEQILTEGKSFFSPVKSELAGNTTTLMSGEGAASKPGQVKSVNKTYDLFYGSPTQSTATTAPASISDSYQKMGFGRIGSIGGKMGELEKASLRLGQAAADRRLKEQSLESETQSRLAKEGFGYQSSLQKQRSELERQMEEWRNEQERKRQIGI